MLWEGEYLDSLNHNSFLEHYDINMYKYIRNLMTFLIAKFDKDDSQSTDYFYLKKLNLPSKKRNLREEWSISIYRESTMCLNAVYKSYSTEQINRNLNDILKNYTRC